MADNLRGHGAKTLGVQSLGDLSNITIHDISMRAGWVLKFFDIFLTIGLTHCHQVWVQAKWFPSRQPH